MSADLIFTQPIVTGSGAARGKNCSVELLGLAIYGDYRHGYRLPCLDRAAQNAVVTVNDRLSEEAKQTRRWRLLVARLALCHAHNNDRLHRRMALWAARSVEHLSDDPRVKVCNDTLERWLAGEATDEELSAASAAASAAAEEAAWEAAWAAHSAWAAAAAEAAEAAAAEAVKAVKAAAAVKAVKAAAEEAVKAVKAAAAVKAVKAVKAAWAAAAANTDDEALIMDWLDAYLSAWHKTAVDEGEAIPADDDEDYQQFLAELDTYLTDAGAPT